MNSPHHIEKHLSRFLDGVLEPAQSKVTQEWIDASPALQADLNAQRRVSSQLKQALSQHERRSSMETHLLHLLSSLPQRKPITPGFNWESWFAFAPLSPRLAVLTLVLLTVSLFAVFYGPVTPPKPAVISSEDAPTGSPSLEERRARAQVSSKSYTESRDSLSRPPGVVSNVGMDSDSSMDNYRDRYGASFESLNSLGYASRGSGQQSGYGGGGMTGGTGGMGVVGETPHPISQENQEAYNYYLRVYGDRFNEMSNGQTLAQADTTQNAQASEPVVQASDKQIADPETSVEAARKIIRNARMNLEAPDVPVAKTQIEALVEQQNGLIANSNTSQDRYSPLVRMTIWVPSERLEAVIREIEALGRALNTEIFSQDISEQYFDIASRVRNLKIQEERLLQLYEREVKKLDEILNVEREIQRVRTQIEQLEGKLRLWSRQISFSTLELSIQQEPEKKPIVQSEPDSVLSPLRRVWRDSGDVFLYSVSIMTGIAASFISTVIFLIPWVFLLILIVFLAKGIYTLIMRRL